MKWNKVLKFPFWSVELNLVVEYIHNGDQDLQMNDTWRYLDFKDICFF